MVKKIKVFICCILAVCMALTTFVVPEPVEAAATVKLPITVTEDFNEVHSLLNLINNARKAKGLDPYTLDAGLNDYAMLRSCESSLLLAHERPNGESVGAIVNGFFAENIAAGQRSAQAVFNDWSGSAGHNSNMMTKGSNLYCGIGCVNYNGSIFWTLVVSDQTVKTGVPMLSGGTRQVNRTMEATTSFLTSRCKFSRWPNYVDYGNMEPDGQGFVIESKTASTSAEVGYEPPVSMLSFSVDNTNVLQINPSNGNLIPVNKGEANVTVTLKGTSFSGVVNIEVMPYGDFGSYTITTDKGESADISSWGANFEREYTGKNITPKLNIVDKYGNTLVEGKDYTLDYKDNKDPGLAQIIIRWLGNYSTEEGGWSGIYFLINEPPKPTATPTPKPTATPKPTQKPSKPNDNTGGNSGSSKPNNNTGSSKPNNNTSKPAAVTPGKVTLRSAKGVSNNKIQINWNKTSGATHYRVYYKVPGSSWKLVATVGSNVTSYTHTSSSKFPIKCGQKYTYTVRGYNASSGKAGSYNTKGLTTRTTPTTVALKTAKRNSNNTVTLSWNKAVGGNYYRIYRRTAGTRWKLIATVRSSVLRYTDKKPVKGKTNAYTIRMYNSTTKVAGGYNTAGARVKVPSSNVTPGKVQLRSIKAVTNNRIRINWKKTTGATHYRIYYKEPGGKWKLIKTVGANTTSYTHVSSSKYPIVCGQKYTYTVRGYNSKSLKAGRYNSRGLTTRTVPRTVSLKSARRNSDNSVTVSWNRSYGGNYYRIYRKTPGSRWKLIATVKSSSLAYVDRNPVKGKKNTYTVRMYNSVKKVAGGYRTKGVSVNANR